jgi:hypothetical protein
LTLNGLHGGISQKIVLFKYKFLLTKRKEPWVASWSWLSRCVGFEFYRTCGANITFR